ncbi:hypothetical protein WKI40_20115 [Kosakonia sacchari]|uniref:hypothetical protein n=1 Tax=Kosakonia sacchari TaxID=1158459 RepID=UPI0030C5EB12
MEAYKNLLAQLAQANATQQAQEQQSAAQTLVNKSAAAVADLEALIKKFNDVMAESLPTSADSAQKIKSRGIALCHKDQGYSANGRSVSLLTKSVNGLRQVEINKASRPLMATQLEGGK